MSRPRLERGFHGAVSGIDRTPMERFASRVAAPALIPYAWWAMESARAMGIDRLYFLSRDGYFPLKIAEILRKRLGLGIGLTYLYGSRRSLYAALAHEDEAEGLAFFSRRSAFTSAAVILGRFRLADGARESILKRGGIADADAPLSEGDSRRFAEFLSGDGEYLAGLRAAAGEAHRAALGYLRQEGLLSGGRFGIADSGWAGSLQRAIGRLTGRGGADSGPVGFYVGLNRPAPPDARAFLFDGEGPASGGARFNLLAYEALACAPHSMISGYRELGGRYGPAFAPAPFEEGHLRFARELEGPLIACAEAFAGSIGPGAYDEAALRALARRALTRWFSRPAREEAELMRAIRISDDSGNGYSLPLIEGDRPDLLRRETFARAAIRKLPAVFGNSRGGAVERLVWPQGSFAASSIARSRLVGASLRTARFARAALAFARTLRGRGGRVP